MFGTGCIPNHSHLLWLSMPLAHSFVYWHNKWLTLPLVGRARGSCQETQVLVEFYRAVWNALNTVFSLQQ